MHHSKNRTVPKWCGDAPIGLNLMALGAWRGTKIYEYYYTTTVRKVRCQYRSINFPVPQMYLPESKPSVLEIWLESKSSTVGTCGDGWPARFKHVQIWRFGLQYRVV